MKQVLFICTGNYYRSRYAEALFNYNATHRNLNWRAISRGLAIHLAAGDLSPIISKMLEQLKIPRECTAPTRQSLVESDFLNSQKIIALQRHEHYPRMLEQFPLWANRIEYWDVADADYLSPQIALKLVDRCVLELVESLEKEASE